MMILIKQFLVVLVLSSAFADEYHPKFRKATSSQTRATEDSVYWNNLAQAELQSTLERQINSGVAKNVILFLGDGMSLDTITAGRIYAGQLNGQTGEEGLLSFEEFPHTGLSKTYNVDSQVPDSAGTATAFLTGVKTDIGTIGVDSTVERSSCISMTNSSKVDSIVNWFQDANKKTGVVTSTRITHATPAGAFAHIPERDWECDNDIPTTESETCPTLKDIARQLIEDEPGSKLDVILGGGLRNFCTTDESNDVIKNRSCKRQDGRQLWEEWLDYRDENDILVLTRSDLLNLDVQNTGQLLGFFDDSHLAYENEKITDSLDVPTLPEMTKTALELLLKDDVGFFLLVEGGRIDHAHHACLARTALDELSYFADSVSVALDMVNTTETLIVVTADHAHTMTISGYPERGNSILGTNEEANDGKDYTTLMYANGRGFDYFVSDGEVDRNDPSEEDTSAFDYVQLATVPLGTETHGGDDVPIYAIGPMSHLFAGVHEQNFIAHAMAYAACVGINQDHCNS